MVGDITLNVLVPLYENEQMALGCLSSINDCAKENASLLFNIHVSDDSSEPFARRTVGNIQWASNVQLSIRETRSPISAHNAVDNWNYLLDEISDGEYYVMLHHDERLPAAELPRLKDSIILLGLEGVSRRRYTRLSRIITYRVIKICPELLLFVNFIGPTACVISNIKIGYNNKLSWLVDIEYYVRLIRKSKTVKLVDVPIKSIYNYQSITESINQYSAALIETRIIGVKPLLRVLIITKYRIKKFFRK
jgi:hypothetical protein